MIWLICTLERNPETGRFLLWSNTQGWVGDKKSATSFTQEEQTWLSLPMGGEWVEYDDFCDQSPVGLHKPDYSTLRPDGCSNVVPLTCALCGTGGSVVIDPDYIQWT